MAIAHHALDSGKFSRRSALCEQTAETAGYLDSTAAAPLQADAEAVVTAIVERRGVVLEPTTGEFTLGSSQCRRPSAASGPVRRPPQTRLRPPAACLALALPVGRPAPYRLSLSLTEAWGPAYMHSKNRTSFVKVQIVLIQHGHAHLDRRADHRPDLAPAPQSPRLPGRPDLARRRPLTPRSSASSMKKPGPSWSRASPRGSGRCPTSSPTAPAA